MKQRDEVEIQRMKLAMRVRAEAGIVRAEWLNQVLPAALAEFDKRLQSGESIVIELPSVKDLIDDAVATVASS